MSEQSPEIGELVKALARVQGAMAPVIKGKANPFFKSKYADLAAIWDALREPLAENGLAVVQTNNGGPADEVTIITTLAHISGQWIRGKLTMRPVKADPQGIGSAITYGRRYALAAIVGIAPEDDDGNAASARTVTPGPQPEKKVATGGGESKAPPTGQPTETTGTTLGLSSKAFGWLCRLVADLLGWTEHNAKTVLQKSTANKNDAKKLLNVLAPSKDRPSKSQAEKSAAWNEFAAKFTNPVPASTVKGEVADDEPPLIDADLF